jgi:hypothetical protein
MWRDESKAGYRRANARPRRRTKLNLNRSRDQKVMRVAELVWREAPAHPGLAGDAAAYAF